MDFEEQGPNGMETNGFFTLLSTFAHWPFSGHWPRKVSKMGFRYTGTDDTLECTQCNQRISGWLETGLSNLERHKRTCGSASHPNQQIHRTNHNRQEMDRLESTTNTHSSGTVGGVPGHASLHNGFAHHAGAENGISNGVMPPSEIRARSSPHDRRENVNTTNTTGIPNDIVSREARTRSPHNSLVVNRHSSVGALSPANRQVPTSQTLPPNGYHSEICLPGEPASEPYNPRHPGYASTHARLQSFADWPADFHITARQMAEAGFFYVNTQDYVRCHYCHGGLHNWLPGDNPMIEHARWFPKCAFVKKVKGAAFIQGVKSGTITRLPDQMTGASNITEPASSYASLPVVPVVREPVMSPSNTTVNTSNAAASETSVKGLLAQVQEEKQKIAAINRELREAKTCHLCHEKDIDTLFLPCTHLVTCQDCAASVTQCPKCGKVIEGTVKTYRC